MAFATKAFFWSQGRDKQPPKHQTHLHYYPLEEIQCYRKKRQLINLLEKLEEEHNMPGLKSERDKERILAAAKKIIEQNKAP